MKSIIVMSIVLFAIVQKCSQVGISQDVSCGDLLQAIFNEDFFYNSKRAGLNLVGIDTITILDKKGYLKSLNCPTQGELSIDTVLLSRGADYSWMNTNLKARKVGKKIYKIKNEDDIPIRILNFNAIYDDQNDPKYRCYFVLEGLKMNGDSLYIHMEKFISNHRIALTYLKKEVNGN